MKISVIVPTHNEAENIKKLIHTFILKNYEIVVVDDNTLNCQSGWAEQYPVRVNQYPVRFL